MSTEQAPEVAAVAAAMKQSAVMVTDGVHSAGPLHPWHEPIALLGALRAAGWQLTRVGDEERLRAVEKAARELIEVLRPREEDGHLTYAVAEPHTLDALHLALDDLDAPQSSPVTYSPLELDDDDPAAAALNPATWQPPRARIAPSPASQGEER